MNSEEVKNGYSLTPGELLKKIKDYYPHHPDLMKDLNVSSITLATSTLNQWTTNETIRGASSSTSIVFC